MKTMKIVPPYPIEEVEPTYILTVWHEAESGKVTYQVRYRFESFSHLISSYPGRSHCEWVYMLFRDRERFYFTHLLNIEPGWKASIVDNDGAMMSASEFSRLFIRRLLRLRNIRPRKRKHVNQPLRGGKNRWRFASYYKHFSTLNERRQYGDYEEQMRAEGLTPKARRSNLPNPWDDYPKDTQRSWKVHRKTQYK